MYLLSSDFRAIASSFCWLDYSTLLFNCPYCRKFLFKLPSIILHQPTNQTHVFLVRSPMIISDQIGQTVYHPQRKETWKGPPKNPYSRWLGFCIFDDHLEACFFLTNITKPPRKGFQLLALKRVLYFCSFSLLFLVVPPQKKVYTSNWWSRRQPPEASMNRPSRPRGSLHRTRVLDATEHIGDSSYVNVRSLQPVRLEKSPPKKSCNSQCLGTTWHRLCVTSALWDDFVVPNTMNG